jgi:hypothetical protein
MPGQILGIGYQRSHVTVWRQLLGVVSSGLDLQRCFGGTLNVFALLTQPGDQSILPGVAIFYRLYDDFESTETRRHSSMDKESSRPAYLHF